uniref:probable E3 ubiquitin-protein ligase HERC4 isoform X1 n=1 Tax=Gasterosteus aculeatus aculeatus TaxID=481459 RepID=UPI001A98452E|nr:probable E3 ubiquitin-protein ligase HERC4 isoform X1 [Gasterosteus aculeatus aculeatus]
MLSWGENCQQGFRLRDGSNVSAGDGVHLLNLGFDITDLSAGHSVLAFIKSNGDAAIIRTTESQDGRRVRGKQKLVKCREKIQAVFCDDHTVTLLSKGGKVLFVDTTRTYIPRPLEAFCNIPVSQVACGSQHSVALTKGGQVYTWGRNSRGQLGLGRSETFIDSPQRLGGLSALPLVLVAAGGEQSFALCVSGAVLGWGRNDCGQLGLGDKADRPKPTPVCYLNTKKSSHISCGKEHTAVLTKNGAVFTFGSGQYGQLGHNSFCDELRPRLVAELFGAKVTKIACGWHHTLVLTESRRVHSFGRGECGQLGHAEESHPSVPLPVQLPQDTNHGPIIENIYAGGNCSFATSVKFLSQEAREESNTARVSNVTTDVIDKWVSECNSKSWKKIKGEILRTFSSASSMNQIFLDQSNDKHLQTSSKYCGLNMSHARHSFKKLSRKDHVLAEVQDAVLLLLPSLDEMPEGVEGLRIFLLLNELLHWIQRHGTRGTSTTLTEAVAAAAQRLSAESLQVLGDWWSSQTSSTKVRHVGVWKKALSEILCSHPVPRGPRLRNLLLVLQNMYNANGRVAEHQRIPEQTFCVEVSQTFLEEDLRIWRSMSNMKVLDNRPFVLCNFPFVMDLKSKKMAFDIYATITQRAHQPMIPYGPATESYFFLGLKLKRASLLEGTFKQLAAAHPQELKKPLAVYYDEDPKLTDVNKRDLFHHLFRKMVSPGSGTFMFNDSETLAWFPSTANEEDKTHFFLFGVLCGLALWNNSVIHLPFPLVLFKKLLGVEPTLEDLKEFSPDVGKSLQCILNYDEDELMKLDGDFIINWDGTEVCLDPRNPEKLLTVLNKKEFVDAYVSHAFNASVEAVFEEFKRGFFRVCDRDPVTLFRPEELQGLLVGQDVYEWAKLKQNTVWDLWIGSSNKQMFWEVFDELTEDQRKDFLWFLTGSRRVPILGMDQVRMKVQVPQLKNGQGYDQHFPEALTCHSILYLPLYSSKEIMREKLTEALKTERVFSM